MVSENSVLGAIETVLEGKKKKLVETNQNAISVGSEFIRQSK